MRKLMEFFCAADKRAHMKYGAAVALCIVFVLMLAIHVSGPMALAAGSVGMGYGVEWYQKVRGEGTAEHADAWASALPGLLMAAVWFVADNHP